MGLRRVGARLPLHDRLVILDILFSVAARTR